jgi:hypothetical protein
MSGFTPKGIMISVSAAMLRNAEDYDRALEQFSKPLMTADGVSSPGVALVDKKSIVESNDSSFVMTKFPNVDKADFANL